MGGWEGSVEARCSWQCATPRVYGACPPHAAAHAVQPASGRFPDVACLVDDPLCVLEKAGSARSALRNTEVARTPADF